jgi:hypothetical protein
VEELVSMDQEELEVWVEWVVLATRGQPLLITQPMMVKVAPILLLKHIGILILVVFRGLQASQVEMGQPSLLRERTGRMGIINS